MEKSLLEQEIDSIMKHDIQFLVAHCVSSNLNKNAREFDLLCKYFSLDQKRVEKHDHDLYAN